tara:strand:- start:8191 stop:10413 length:2223 start_codon:yes stop_codon:yes gene_type:complete
MNKIKYFIILHFFTLSLANESYLWPTNASTTVTALFGEERPHRYHAGIDVRTWGKIGYKLYATSDGYIKRIRTGSKGYGKALYIQLSDGNTAVYAHLDRFTPSLNTSAKLLQQYYNSYTIDHTYDSNEYPVRKGDLIGYSGDTGGISGAHLHFELRDEHEKPLNPLQFYTIKDNMPPVVNQLAFLPLTDTTSINGTPIYKLIKFRSKNPFEYEFLDTIAIDGHFGLALDAIDRIDDQPFKFGVYKITLKVDSEIEYQVSYDTYRFEDAKFIYTERDYALKRETGKRFYRLFNNNNNENLLFTDKLNSKGQTFIDSSFHNIEILVEDYHKNEISIKGVILHQKSPEINIIQDHKNNTISFEQDSLFTLESVSFIKTGRYNEDKRFSTTLTPSDSTSFVIPNWDKPFTVLEIQPVLKYGIKPSPQYLPTRNYNIQSVEGTALIKHFENGLTIQFVEDKFTGLIPQLSFAKDGYQFEYPFYRIDKNVLSTRPIPYGHLENLNSLEIMYASPTHYSFRKEISSIVVNPKKEFSLSINAGEMKVSGEKNTFYDSTFVWIEKIDAPQPPPGELISGPYKLGPFLIPMTKKVDLDFTIFDSSQLSSSGIFYFDKKNEEWVYLETEINEKKSELSTRILSGEIFAVIREFIPPEVNSLYPNIGATYRQQDLQYLEFFVDDAFSGIDGEDNVVVKIDEGKPLIFEYNIHQKRIHYPFDDQFNIGSHLLHITAKDNVGNEKIIRGTFEIK